MSIQRLNKAGLSRARVAVETAFSKPGGVRLSNKKLAEAAKRAERESRRQVSPSSEQAYV